MNLIKLYQYLYEFGMRSLYIILGFSVMILLFFFYQNIVLFISLPKDTYFIYTRIDEVYIAYLTLNLSLSCFIYLPICVVQIYIFLRPGLYFYQSQLIEFYLKRLILLYFLLMSIGFFIAVPGIWQFNREDTIDLPIYFEATIAEYIDLMSNVGFILIISLPFVMLAMKIFFRYSRRLIYITSLFISFYLEMHLIFWVTIFLFEFWLFNLNLIKKYK